MCNIYNSHGLHINADDSESNYSYVLFMYTLYMLYVLYEYRTSAILQCCGRRITDWLAWLEGIHVVYVVPQTRPAFNGQTEKSRLYISTHSFTFMPYDLIYVRCGHTSPAISANGEKNAQK